MSLGSSPAHADPGYGAFEVTHRIGANPHAHAVDDLAYEMAYRCTIQSTTTTPPSVVTEDTLTVPGNGLAAIGGVPAGAVCELWQTETHGGVSSHPAAAPARFEIPADPDAPATQYVTITTSFPTGESHASQRSSVMAPTERPQPTGDSPLSLALTVLGLLTGGVLLAIGASRLHT